MLDLHFTDHETHQQVIVTCKSEDFIETLRSMPSERYHFCYAQDVKPAEPLVELVSPWAY